MQSHPNIGFVTDEYVFFWDGIFSQWKIAHFEDDDGIHYRTAEHYMMYHKALTLERPDVAAKILETYSPRDVKYMARAIQATPEVMAKYDAVKLDIVTQGNMYKFTQNKEYRDIMLKLYPRKFVEASPADRIWGIGMDISHPDLFNTELWGQNLLGKALDAVAETLSNKSHTL